MSAPCAPPHAVLEAALAPHQHPEFFFVNVGASDGVTNDPVHPFVMKYGWHGLLIEPVPHVFDKLRNNYDGVEGIAFEQAAIGSTGRPFFHLPEAYCEAHPWARQIGSFDLERVRWGLVYIAKEKMFEGTATLEDLDLITESAIPCRDLNAVLNAHRVERFDFLNVDAEGVDVEILEMIDFARRDVRAVTIETRPAVERDRQRITALLEAAGLRFLTHLDWATDAFVRPP